MKLIKLNDEYYLVDVDMSRMAKDLPIGTCVFCLGETHMNDINECLRLSSKNDNCYGCQPLIASTKKYDNVYLLDKVKVEKLLTYKKQDVIKAQLFCEEYAKNIGNTDGTSAFDFKTGYLRAIENTIKEKSEWDVKIQTKLEPRNPINDGKTYAIDVDDIITTPVIWDGGYINIIEIL